MIFCGDCNQTGMVVCKICAGDGDEFYCENCEGSGKTRCKICDGQGEIIWNLGPFYVKEDQPIAHKSDCAQHNEPAYPNEACNCGGR